MQTKIFEKGIKFKCQGSSNCCVSRGSYGFVFLSKKDLKKLAKFFAIPIKKFELEYCQKTNDFTHLKEINKNGNCIFLDNKRCSVYKSRPTQCRTWPFWANNMNSKTWNKEVINFCPGIGKGKIINRKSIEKLLKIDLEDEKLIYNDQKINFQLK